MPYKKKYSRKSNKRGYRRYGRKKFMPKYRRKPSVTYQKHIVPDTAYTVLKYCTGLQMFAASAAANRVFRGNSVFDPDLTGAGHQPVGYDQWAQFYDKYQVLASKIIVKARHTSSVNQMTMLSVQPKLEQTNELDYLDIVGDAYAKSCLMPTDSAGYYKTLTNYMSTKKMWGKKSISDEDFCAETGLNPINQWYWIVNIDDVLSSGNQDSEMYVEIHYYVKFYSRAALNRS